MMNLSTSTLSRGEGRNVQRARLFAEELELRQMLSNSSAEVETVSSNQIADSSEQPFLATMGDSNRDGVFDQNDLTQVLANGKYLSGEPASWEDGDWNVDGAVDQKDMILALQTGAYGRVSFDASGQIRGPFKFEPLTESVGVGSLPANAPFALPDGFTQEVIWDERGYYSGGPNFYGPVEFPGFGILEFDWPDMNTVNETGKSAGRYLYTTHEVRPPFLNDAGEFGSHGGLTVQDLLTGERKVLAMRADWEALDGIEWTPWGSILFAEEVVESFFKDPDWPQAESGLLYELFLDADDPSIASEIVVRPAAGSLSHEGIAVDSKGNIYVIDEFQSASMEDGLPDGGIYKFTPAKRGDLSSGNLYALNVIDESAAPGNGTGAAQWVELTPGLNGVVTDPTVNARKAAHEAGVTTYRRPEDVELIGDVLYVATTTDARVFAIDLTSDHSPFINEFAVPGVNGADGLEGSDNLASDHAGNLFIAEDNTPGDIWVATPDLNHDGYADSVNRFASLSTVFAEPTGIYFGHDPNVLYVNVQHGADPPSNSDDCAASILCQTFGLIENDKVIAIRRK